MKSIKKQKTKQSGNMDLFRDLKDSNKLNDIDDKIKFFKSKLTSLIESNSSSKETRDSSNCLSLNNLSNKKNSFDSESNENDTFDNSLLSLDETKSKEGKICMKNNQNFFNCDNQNVEEINKSRYNPEPVATKFSNWLSTTIDLIDEKIKDDKTPKNKKSLINFNAENSDSSFNDSTFKSKSAFKLPQHKVESLLYESFLLQNLGKHWSSSEESEPEVVEVSSKHIKNLKFSKKRSSRKRKRCSKIMKKVNRKRKRLVTLNSSNSDIEVVNIDTSNLNLETNSITNTEQTDLQDINWDEPFYLEETNAFEPFMVEEVDNIEEEKNSENVFVENTENSGNISSNKSEVNPKQSTSENKIESTNDLASDCKSESKKTCWECPICFEESKGQEVVTTLCGHIFCKQCIENHLSVYGQVCPACRTDICNKPLITLFNF